MRCWELVKKRLASIYFKNMNMNIRINNKAHPKTLLIATKRYIEKMIQELSLVSKRKNKFKDDIPQDFIKRESTTIIANNIHAIQSLYQWERINLLE